MHYVLGVDNKKLSKAVRVGSGKSNDNNDNLYDRHIAIETVTRTIVNNR